MRLDSTTAVQSASSQLCREFFCLEPVFTRMNGERAEEPGVQHVAGVGDHRVGVARDPRAVKRRLTESTLAAPRPPVILPPVPIPRLVLEQPPAEIDRDAALWKLAEAGGIPRELDRRAQSRDIAEGVLREGVRLGAVRLGDGL